MDITNCTPAFLTAACFVAVILRDMMNYNYRAMVGNALLGLVATLLMSVLCQRGFASVAWGLFALPFVMLIVGMIGMAVSGSGTKATYVRPPWNPPAPNPNACPCGRPHPPAPFCPYNPYKPACPQGTCPDTSRWPQA